MTQNVKTITRKRVLGVLKTIPIAVCIMLIVLLAISTHKTTKTHEKINMDDVRPVEIPTINLQTDDGIKPVPIPLINPMDGNANITYIDNMPKGTYNNILPWWDNAQNVKTIYFNCRNKRYRVGGEYEYGQ